MKTRLEHLIDYLEKAKTKPVNSLSKEMVQQILIMRLRTWIEREQKHVAQRV